jgi:stage IV sporulation protein FB
MHDHSGWYLNLGRWASVRVRLHASFLFLAVAMVYLATLPAEAPETAGWTALLTAFLLLASVGIHELGHCFAAWRLGGAVHQVSLFPLGGLTPAQIDGEPQDEMRLAMAGPTANLLVCLALLPVMWFANVDLLRLFHILRPPQFESGLTWLGVGQTVFYLNWLLTIVNLIPATPLDGGRILRAALAPSMGSTQATIVQARIGQIVALVLPLIAWGIGLFEPRPLFWAPVAVVSIMLYFCGKQELDRLIEHEQEEGGPFGYDFSQGYTSLEQRLAPPAPRRKNALQRWLERRRHARQQRELETIAAEESRLDGILVKLNEVGLPGLTVEERDILHRVSERYRNRQ